MTSVPIIDGLTRRTSIRGILLLIMVATLLPLLVFSTSQGIARLQRDRDAERQHLLEAARLTSASDRNVIASARALLGVLSVSPGVRSLDQERCGQILKQAVREYTAFSHFSVTALGGTVECSSDPRAVGMAPFDARLWQQLKSSGFRVTASTMAPFAKQPVLLAIMPLTRADGAFDGAITASIDLDWFRRLLSQQHDRDNVAVALVDGTGRLLASSQPLPWERLKISADGAAADSNAVFDVRDLDSTRWSYAVAPLHVDKRGGESFHIVYAAAQPARFGADWWFAAGYFLLPLLAVVLASAAIWYGANRAILRWIAELGTLAAEIGSSQGRDMQYGRNFGDAPSEVRKLAADLLRMGNAIAERDRSLRQSVASQTAVAMELHHRVRNNLQVMDSFVSLQTRRLPSGDARHVLEKLQLRVATMALVNGFAYAEGELTTVSIAQLLNPLAELLTAHIPGSFQVVIDTDVAVHMVDLDRAVPISLWIVEAAMDLHDRTDPALGEGHFTIQITVFDDAGESKICVVVSALGLLPDQEVDGLNRRLLQAFARQVGGSFSIDDSNPAHGKFLLALPDADPADLAERMRARARPY